jgi:hypothetical protein
MNQDHVNMIMLALLALNTIMLIYCSVKRASEEFRDTTRSSAIKSGVATTQAPVTPAPAKAAAPTAAAKAPGWAIGVMPSRRSSGRSPT